MRKGERSGSRESGTRVLGTEHACPQLGVIGPKDPCVYYFVRRFLQRVEAANPQAACILDFEPGQAAQVDFGTGPMIMDIFTGEVFKTWVFVMTLFFSRHPCAEMVLNQTVEIWLGSHRRAFAFFSGMPAKVILDNAKCAVIRACYHDPEVQRSSAEAAEG